MKQTTPNKPTPGYNSPSHFAADESSRQRTATILEIGEREDDYKFLLSLDDESFQAWQDYLVKPSYDYLFNSQGSVGCKSCNACIKSHKDAYMEVGQFYHRGECSSDVHHDITFRNNDFWEIKYHQRMALGRITDQEFYLSDTVATDEVFVAYDGGYTNISASGHGDFTIWLDAEAYLSLGENEEIGVFFKLLRYLLDQEWDIDNIMEELSKNNLGITLLTNDSPLRGYEVFIENAFLDDLQSYILADSTSFIDPGQYPLAESPYDALGKMIGILAISKGERRAAILNGIQRVKKEDLDFI